MGLFDFLKKKNREIKDEDGNIMKPYEYYEILEREVKPLENILVGFSSSLPGIKKVDDRIKVLKSLIESYYELRSKCVSLGKDYEEYFSKMWEHCHNSKNPDFCFVERYEEELNELGKNRNVLFAEQSLHEHEALGLQDKVLQILHDSGEITQTDIYKKFDPVVQSDIQSILYFLGKDGVIERKKYKSTYLVKLREEK